MEAFLFFEIETKQAGFYMTQLDLPNLSSILRQSGGLWTSAYHLVHPEGSNFNSVENFYDVSTIIHKNFAPLSEIIESRKDFEESGEGTLSTNAPNLVQYSTPFNPTPLADAAGSTSDLRGNTVYFSSHCSEGSGIYNPKCFIGDPDADLPECPDKNCGCVKLDEEGNPVEPPEPDCDEPAEPGVSTNGNQLSRIKGNTICSTFEEFCVPVIYQGDHLSTFQLLGNQRNPWDIVSAQLVNKRSNDIEGMLINGVGQVDCNGVPTFGGLGGGNITQPGSVSVIAGGCAVALECGINLLEEALAGCLGGEIGMIHSSPAPSLDSCDKFYTETVDYGDGMGPRLITRTKTRGNILVTGGGYDGGIGPDGCPCKPGEAWMYGTGMVHLVYGHPMYTPDRQNINFNGEIIEIGGAAGAPTTNDIYVIAEQAIVPVYEKCCIFAVKVSLKNCY